MRSYPSFDDYHLKVVFASSTISFNFSLLSVLNGGDAQKVNPSSDSKSNLKASLANLKKVVWSCHKHPLIVQLNSISSAPRFADIHTHFSRQYFAAEGRSVLFRSLTHTSVFDQPVRRLNYEPAVSSSGSVPTVACAAPNVVTAQTDIAAIRVACRMTPQFAQASHRPHDALDHAHHSCGVRSSAHGGGVLVPTFRR